MGGLGDEEYTVMVSLNKSNPFTLDMNMNEVEVSDTTVDKLNKILEKMIIEKDKKDLDLILNKPVGYYKYPIGFIFFGKYIRVPFICKRVKYDYSKWNKYCKDNDIKCYEDLVKHGKINL